jgi:hypothetical protein
LQLQSRLAGPTLHSGFDCHFDFLLTTLCPWEGGRAIALGQFLYTVVADSTMSAIPYDCPEPEQKIQMSNAPIGNSNESVTIFPNPVIDHVVVSAPEMITHVSLFSSDSKLLYDYVPLKHEFVINTSKLESGLYLIFVETEHQTETLRFIVQK